MKKRVLSVLLLLAVLLSLFPFGSVSAAPAEHEHAHSHIAAAPTKGGPKLKAWDVKGGKIYYDPGTDTIVSADPTVTEVYIPQEVADMRIPKFIGYGAFKNCTNLTKVTLPGCVEGIEQQAFYGCDKLRELEYQGNIDVISKVLRFNEGTKTFYGSDNKPLANLTFYAGRGSYLESDFPFTYGGIRVELRQPGTPITENKYFDSGTIYINEATREIVASSSDLRTKFIPDKLGGVQLESIGSYALSRANLKSVVSIGDNIKHIRGHAFYQCGMRALGFPYSLESIDPSAVEGCYNLTTFYIGTHDSGKNFSTMWDGQALYKRPTKTQGWTLVLCPPKCSGIDMVASTEVIGTGAFAYNDTLTEINLPAGLKTIGNNAFANPYSKIKTIQIPESVTKIGYRAFPYAEEVYFYGDAPAFNLDAFNTEDRTTLYYIEGKEGWTTPRYGNYTIYGAPQTYPTYPWCEQSNPPGHTIEKVAGKAPTCTEDGYEEYWCCKTCSKLFSDANGTQQISTPRVRTATGHEWTWTIDKEATPTEAGSKHQKCDRCGATRYENTVIPKTHGDSVVAYEVEGGNIYFDTATGTVVAADKTVTGADIPEYIYGTRVTAIGDDAFNSLLSLKRVTLPEGLKKIGKTAFAWCSITTIVIPASVTEIGDAAFVTYGDSDALRSIYFLGDAPQFGDSAFYSDYDMDGFKMNKDRTLYFMEGKARWTTPKYGNYSNQDGLQAYPTQLWTHEHTLTHVPAVKAECEKDGNEEYWKCSKCYSVFADAEGSEQLDEIPVIPALGHNYQRKADDLRPDGAAKYHLECTRCGKRGASGTVAAHTHFFPPAQITPRVSATCTKIGMYATCKCKVCELTFYRKEFDKWVYLSKPTDVIIKALGHDIVKVEYAAPTCTEDGSREHWRCKRCGNTFADAAGNTPYNGETVIPALGHKWLWVTDTEATETAAGVKHEECFNCGEKRNEGTEIPMRAHTHSEVSEGGTLSAIPAKNPTCTEDGWQAYWECNTCRKKYADPKGSTEIAAPIVIPAAGHVLTHYEKEEATCTDTGRKERWFCDRCRKSFANASATTELDTIFIPALGHDPIRVLKKDATCTEDGWTSHVECRRCKALFEDYACTKPTNPTIPALGHNWVWNTVDPNMPRWQYCTRCGKQKNFSNEPQHTHKADEPHINKIAEVPATCTEAGRKEHYYCEICKKNFMYPTDGMIFTATPAMLRIDPIGHSCELVEKVEPTCTKDGRQEYYRCKNCGKAFMDSYGQVSWLLGAKAIPAKGHTLEAIPALTPTCTLGGYEAHWKCKDCEMLFSDSEGKNIIYAPEFLSPLGHKLTMVAEQAPTCTEKGSEAYWRCEQCNKLFADEAGQDEIKTAPEIPATGHAWLWVTDTEPTEDKPGVKHEECAVCHAKQNEGTEMPKLEHTHDLTAVAAKAPTCTEGGNEAYWRCTKCGKLYEDAAGTKELSALPVLTALGHKLTAVPEKAPTCTENGNEAYWKCERCARLFSDGNGENELLYLPGLKATGHTWDEGKVTTAPTCEKDGVKTITCTVCKETKTETIPATGKHHYGEDGKCEDCGKTEEQATCTHTWNEGEVTTAPTCTADGEKTLTCTKCGSTMVVKLSALDHAWNEGEVTTAPTCEKDGVKTFTCTRCKETKTETIPATGHKLTAVAAKAPTCTEDGNEAYWKCTKCGKLFSDDKGKHEISVIPVIEKLDHAWDAGKVTTAPTCDKDGVKTFTCTRCKETKTETIPATGHKLTAVAAKAPTCTENGNEAYWKCTKCDKLFSDGKGENEISVIPVIKKLDHAWNEGEVTTAPTCDKDGVKTFTCTRCKETKTETIPATGHKLTAVAAKAPTCTEDGNEAYWKCTKCDKLFSDDKGEHEISAVPEINATGHKWEWVIDTEPTEDKPGVKHEECSVCHEKRSMNTEIPPLGHTHSLTAVAAKAPTCTEDGNEAYWKCTKCGKLFSDDKGEHEISAIPVIKKLDHAWNEGEVTTAPTCEKDGVKTFTCTRCKETKTETIPATGHKLTAVAAKAPTCTENGNEAYWKCTKCDKLFSDDKGENEISAIPEINATGHKWEWVIDTEPTEDKSGVKHEECSVCHEKRSMNTEIPPLGHTHSLTAVAAKAPTCTEDGNEAYWKCTKCGKLFSDDKGEHEISAIPVIKKLDHAWNEGEVTTAPTCEKDGVKTFTCTRCKETKTETIPATGHKLTAVAAKAPTCTEDGNEAYWKCTKCGKLFSDDKGENEISAIPVIKKLDHAWNEGEVTTAPTCDKDGVKTFTCTRCKETKTETIPATGHKLTAVAAKAPTCTEDGNEAYWKCTKCGKLFSDDKGENEISAIPVIKKLDHAWNEGEVTTAPTCEKDGVKTFTCTRCKETKTETIPATGKHHYGEDGKCEDCGKTEEQATCTHTWNEGEVTTAPTCTADGEKTLTCTKCGSTEVVKLSALDHAWNEGEVTTAPTCDKDGVKTFTCTRCKETKTETIPATGKHHYGEDGKCEDCGKTEEQATCTHTWNEGEVTTAPTCTADGEKTLTCTKCGSTMVVKLSALDHAWDEGEVTTAPTCDKDGVKTFTCTRCKETKTETIPATGKHHYGEDGKCEDCGKTEEQATCTHTWNEGEVTTAPTCTADGEKTLTCTKCGSTEVVKLSALDHAWNEGEVTTAPTCDKDGVKTFTCTRCEETKTETIPATGKHHYGEDGKCEDCGKTEEQATCTHTWNEGEVTTAPTCEADGVKTYTCTKCGSTKLEAIPATGHNWSWVVDKEATETENGVKHEECSNCHEKQNENTVIPMTGHTHSLTANEKKEATCTENGYEAFWKCEGCGKFFADAEGKTELEAPVKIDALGHAYGDWTPAKAPNCTEKGEETRTCSRCGDVETRELPALGHNYVDGTCTNCGAADPNGGTELTCYFRDLDDCPYKWYHEPIDYVFANGLMNGVGDRRFAPEGTMTRAMMVTVLYRMAGSPEHTESSTFTDVASGRYYSTAIAWAQANNIVDGVGKGKFAPDAPVTREQIATILWRYEGKQSASADMSKFKDAGTISNYAREAMAWAVDKGLYIGDAGNLKPTTPATRAEFAILIMRYRGGSYPCPEIK